MVFFCYGVVGGVGSGGGGGNVGRVGGSVSVDTAVAGRHGCDLFAWWFFSWAIGIGVAIVDF